MTGRHPAAARIASKSGKQEVQYHYNAITHCRPLFDTQLKADVGVNSNIIYTTTHIRLPCNTQGFKTFGCRDMLRFTCLYRNIKHNGSCTRWMNICTCNSEVDFENRPGFKKGGNGLFLLIYARFIIENEPDPL